MFGGMKFRVVSLFKMAHNGLGIAAVWEIEARQPKFITKAK